MNDNIRYISLQYIKGNNYDKITCIDNISDLLSNLIENSKGETNKLLSILEDIKKTKCEIGESLLDDLINYIEFNSLRKQLSNMIETANNNLEKTKENYEENEELDNSNELFSELTKLVLEKKLENKKENNLLKFIEVTDKLYNIFKVPGDNDNNPYENLKIARIELEKEYKKLKDKKNNTLESIANIDIVIKNYKDTILVEILKEIIEFKSGKIPPYKILIRAKKILKYFNLIFQILKDNKKGTIKRSLDNSDKLIKLYNKYLYICNNNIKKYENIFSYNEIDNIDEIFMIVSYSKFLKKLKKIKESLQSRDIGKIERNLIHFLDKFFNIHGFNTPEKMEDPGDINYIVDRILNYT
jgi:hypothetical protein